MNFIEKLHFDNLLNTALIEDIGTGDHTTFATIPSSLQAQAVCKIKANGVIAGLALVPNVLNKFDTSIEYIQHITDGSGVQAGDFAFTLRGKAQIILMAERLILNILQRMSGIATHTRAFVDAIVGTGCQVLDTRKTSPGLRLLEKWAVHLGGGVNHRFGLYDMILIKDNHIDCAGGITQALQAVQNYLHTHNKNLDIVIETRTLAEVEEVLAYGKISRILLDNMPNELLRTCVQTIAERFPTEASGNITLENARSVAETGVNYISVGALTHSVRALDMSLKIDLQKK